MNSSVFFRPPEIEPDHNISNYRFSYYKDNSWLCWEDSYVNINKIIFKPPQPNNYHGKGTLTLKTSDTEAGSTNYTMKQDIKFMLRYPMPKEKDLNQRIPVFSHVIGTTIS